MAAPPPPYDAKGYPQGGYPPPGTQPGYPAGPQYGAPQPQYGAPQPQYGAPQPQYGAPYGQTTTTANVVVCQQPQPQTVIVHREGVNHALHCIISFFFWPWIIVWIVLCITDGS